MKSTKEFESEDGSSEELHKEFEAEDQTGTIQRVKFSIFCVLSFLAALGFVYADQLALATSYRYDTEQDLVSRALLYRVMLLMPIAAFFGYTIFLYLEGTSFLRRGNSQLEAEVDAIRFAKIAESLKGSVEKLSKNQSITEVDVATISDAIDAAVAKSLPGAFLERIESKYGRSIQHGLVAAGFDDLFQRTKNRLRDFKEELGRKANVNLLSGLAIGVLGLAILIYFISSNPSTDEIDQIGKYFYYLSRLSLVLIIESVAIFFLRQYQRAVNDEKFVANEITNIELKLVALKTATLLQLNSGIEVAVADLATTDRNRSVPHLKPSQSKIASSSNLNEVIEGLKRLRE